MDLRRLRYFARVAEDGSLTRAAGVLRIAQPALSRQMRLLEEELGVPLFARTPRGMRLTEEGTYLHAATTGPLRALELALQNVRSLPGRIEGSFVIGMPSSVGDILAGPLMMRVRADYPDIRLAFVEAISGSLFDWLLRGLVDFAVAEAPARDERVVDAPIFSDRPVLVGPMASDLDPARPMPFPQAARLPLILSSHHLGLRQTLNEAAARRRCTLNVQVEADSVRIIKQLVEHGVGYAILPPAFIVEECRAARLRWCPVDSPALPFSLHLCHRRHDHAVAGGAGETVIACIREAAAMLGHPAHAPVPNAPVLHGPATPD